MPMLPDAPPARSGAISGPSAPKFDEHVSLFIGAPDCAFAPFKSANRHFQKFLTQLLTLRDDYRAKVDTICKNMKADLDVLTDARARFDAAYAAYKHAADDLKSAADRRAANLADLKTQFVTAQKTAVDLHTHMNEMTAQTAMKMEGGLTAYEEAEQWKTEQIKAFMGAVAEWAEQFSKQLEASNATFMRLKRNIPSDEALLGLMDGSLFPDPRACDEFQAVKIDPVVAQYLDGPGLFPGATQEGKALFRVTKACPAEGIRLAVTPGEIICQLEDKGDSIWAANVNDARGLVPRSAITAY